MNLGSLFGGFGFSAARNMQQNGMLGIGGKLMDQSPRFAGAVMPFFAKPQDGQNMAQFLTGMPIGAVEKNADTIKKSIMPGSVPNNEILGYGAANFQPNQVIPMTGLF